MKKITQLIFIFFIFSFSLSAQVAYYDAITLKDDLVYDEVQKRWQWAHGSSHEILRQYLKDVSSIQDMRKEIANNPFLKDYYLNASSGEDSEAYLKEVKEFIPSIAGKLGGLDVTNFAQGLSKFMIERAKAELNAAFFAKFKKFTKDADVALLFPVTTNRLSYLLSYQYTEMIDQLRNAFYEDLNNLPDNTLVLLEEGSSFYALWTNNPEFTIAVNSLKLIRQLDYLSPPDFIAQLQTVTKDAINAANGDMVKIQKIENFGSSLQLAAIFSESVRASSGTRNWVSSADFYEHIVKDPVTRRIFNGLVYQLIKKESISFNKVFLSDEINNKKAELEWFMNRVDEFVFLANKVDHSLGEIKKYRKEGQTINLIILYCLTFLSVLFYLS